MAKIKLTDDQLFAGMKEGLSVKEIALRHQIATSTVYKRLNVLQVNPARTFRIRQGTAQKIKSLLELTAQGLNPRAIAQYLGCSVSYVYAMWKAFQVEGKKSENRAAILKDLDAGYSHLVIAEKYWTNENYVRLVQYEYYLSQDPEFKELIRKAKVQFCLRETRSKYGSLKHLPWSPSFLIL